MSTAVRPTPPVEVLRYAAFTTTPAGGNPAGVVLQADGLDPADMTRIAADLGYSETAFLSAAPAGTRPGPDETHRTVRYVSPRAEVPFCGHATIAAAIARAAREGTGTLVLHTRSGRVPVRTRWEDGALTATLTSVPPRVLPADDADVDRTLDLLGWHRDELDPRLPPRVAFAGAHHLVLAAATRPRLSRLEYDLDALADLGAIEPPVRLTLRQGHDMGRPSTLLVDVGSDPARGVDVTGTAVLLD